MIGFQGISNSSPLHAGYGDITPYTPLEVGVSMIYMFVGVAYFGYLIK